MIKYLLPLFVVVTFMSCHYQKSVKTETDINQDAFLHSEFTFNDCDDFIDFLKIIIVNNKEDTSIHENRFTIPHIKSSYKFSKKIFHPECLIGISTVELDEIFGERAILKTQSGTIVTNNTGYYSDWYYLDGDDIMLAFDVFINKNVVEGFKIMPHAVDSNTARKKKD